MTSLDILDAIKQRLLEKWPDRTIYMEVCPAEVNRPSFWLAVEKNEQTDANRFMVRNDLQIRLNIYDEADEEHDVSWYRLAKETSDVMEHLSNVLLIGTRHLKLTLKALPRDPDRAHVQLNMSWLDSHTGTGAGTTVPAADSYTLQIRDRKK